MQTNYDELNAMLNKRIAIAKEVKQAAENHIHQQIVAVEDIAGLGYNIILNGQVEMNDLEELEAFTNLKVIRVMANGHFVQIYVEVRPL